jgi:hypothetical protein
MGASSSWRDFHLTLEGHRGTRIDSGYLAGTLSQGEGSDGWRGDVAWALPPLPTVHADQAQPPVLPSGYVRVRSGPFAARPGLVHEDCGRITRGEGHHRGLVDQTVETFPPFLW